ncbi:MAG TPA: hypothetical protein VGR28_07755 [Candidatus Thermoplasmatota archaeon]|jgi:hypothetical protein|nr:hypothetical protein [Candidatus Thermoplasmatota archaeon]
MRVRAVAVLAALGLLLVALPSPVASDAAPTQLTPVARVAGSGNDVAIRGNYAYLSGNSGAQIIDVTNPAAPVVKATVPCRGKDIGVFDYGGRRFITLSWQGGTDSCPNSSGSSGIRLVDVTNPSAPVILKQVSLRFGSHTNTPYGDTGYVYNSAYDLFNPMNHHRAEIIDARDPANPHVATEFLFPVTSTSPGCHDIWPDPARNRAICSAITETMYWDTTDPLAPLIVSTIYNPLQTIHHNSAIGHGGNWLFMGDEFLGVLGPGLCAPQSQHRIPLGAVWVYDISVPLVPIPMGYWTPTATTPTGICTTHNFNVVEGTDIVVGASYRGGSYLVDFSNPLLPVTLDIEAPADGVAWSTYASNGYAYAGDTSRGLDIYRLD